MAIDRSDGALNARIDALRVGFAGYRNSVRQRNAVYLRAYSPKFETRLSEHDQWADPFRQEDVNHHRSSYNLTRAVVDIWSALEASEFPAIRWQPTYIPLPMPSTDPVETARRQMVYDVQKDVARTITTMREQALLRHVRRSRLTRHFFRAIRRKNLYGHSWMKTIPDRRRRTFNVYTNIDPSTVYPVYSSYDDDRLDAILVATRRSAQAVNEQWPGTLPMSADGLTLARDALYYNPTQDTISDADFAYVWVEDYWVVDASWRSEPVADSAPIESRVLNVIRANQRIVQVVEYPGWRDVPYIQWQNEDERDRLGWSIAGAMLPLQDSFNRQMSQQQDVIAGESRPKYKYRGDSERQITLSDESVISLDPDEDIEQIQTRIDVFPTDRHHQQLLEIMSRITGLPDTVWGRITAAQNSGRALSTAWRATATRGVPKVFDNSTSSDRLLNMWCDWLELYAWDDAPELFSGNRDFELDFPNQEPRDFSEVSMEAINALQNGLLDIQGAMEARGEKSPDEMMYRVRRDYQDIVFHPEKKQAQLAIERMAVLNQIEKAQAELGLQQQVQQMSAEMQAAAADKAQTQAAQRGAQTRQEGGPPLPATAPGQAANAGQTTKAGSLVQDGQAFNRIITNEEL